MKLKLGKILTALLAVSVIVLSLPSISRSEQPEINGKKFDGKKFYRSLSGRLGRHRNDYPQLSDLEFANFRMVHTNGIAERKLFRSSSPVSTWGERNRIADNAAKLANVKTFINLADSDKSMKAHGGYEGSYYSTQKVICLNLGMKYSDKKFRKSLADGIRFMAANEPPYLIHCSLGKDRAGFVCALIECLAGAGIREVINDYMISFKNYFGITEGSDEYEFVARYEIYRFLCTAFGLKSLEGVNLADAAARYFFGIGVSPKDINTLRGKLSHE